jgi:hypothetical protein
MSRESVQFASLHTEAAKVDLGWSPCDARARLQRERPAHERWLIVHGRIECGAGRWEFADQALLEAEAEAMGRFLLARPWPVGASTTSVESLITFTARDAGAGSLGIDIRFRGEAGPPCFGNEDSHSLWRVGVLVNIDAREHQVQAFARTWLGMLGVSA